MLSTAIEKFRNKIEKIIAKPFDQRNKIIFFFFIGLLLVGYTHIRSNPETELKNGFRIDTIIPNGYVLIPIKLLNASAISTVIGSHGVADIYSTIEGEKSKLLFSKAKIIKSAEIDDLVFSVLVKESKAHLLSNTLSPFFAAVQNPNAKGNDSELAKNPRIQIIYQN